MLRFCLHVLKEKKRKNLLIENNTVMKNISTQIKCVQIRNYIFCLGVVVPQAAMGVQATTSSEEAL